ncbi:glycine receptor subunit alphaZ1-like [Glandiceps talaboti]
MIVLVLCLLAHIMQMVVGTDDDYLMASHEILVESLTNIHHLHALRPDDEGHPVLVNVSMHIDSFDWINPAAKQYAVTTAMEMKWYDLRLKHLGTTPATFNTPFHVEKIWKPDIFFEQEKEGKFLSLINENRVAKVYPDGLVIYMFRISMTLACNMKLYNYPMDSHTCLLTMMSFAYDSDELLLTWDGETGMHPIAEEIPQFQWTNVEYVQEISDHMNLRKRSKLTVKFAFSHEMTYFIFTAYIPTTLLVMVSWITFWLRPDATPARAALGATTILTTVTQFTSARRTLRGVSYVTGIDVWLATCVLFISAAMMEFALVNYLFTIKKYKAVKKKSQQLDLNSATEISMKSSTCGEKRHNSEDDGGNDVNHEDITRNRYMVEMKNKNNASRSNCGSFDGVVNQSTATAQKLHPITEEKLAKQIDSMSRITFPVVFIVFTIVYWCVYYQFWSYFEQLLLSG